MNDIVGAVSYDVIAEFDAANFNEGIAKELGRTRDEFGRFVKEHRSISQNMMKDMGSILGSGTASAMSVVTKNMTSAADAAGKGFTARIAAAMKSVPKSVGQALSSGAMGVVSTAGEKLGQHVSDAFASQVQKSAPFWKSAFTQSFNQAANVDTAAAMGKLAEKIKGGGENAGKSFEEALGDRFSKAGITASAKLGNFAAQVANKLVPGSREAGDKSVGEIISSFTEKLPTGVKVGAGLAASAAIAALVSRLTSGGREAADGLGNELADGGEQAGKKAGEETADGYEDEVKKLPSIAARAMEQVKSSLGAAAGAAGRFAAQTLGDALKLGANAAGAAVAGILGTSLTKGLGRLKAIDNAEASLRGLASTANHVPEVMEAVNNAVTGTAFGLDQGAKAAAQFAAAGVPLSDMERHLGALANTAAAAGGDFDGVAGIFAKVAAGGKVTGEVLNQLTDRGLAALPALAEQLGITADEARKMVSEGSVSFDDFSQAMDAAMGAAAIEQAKTFSGLMSNVGASMGRLGAMMQKPFFEATKIAMPGVINLFNQLKNVIEPLMETIATMVTPAAERLGAALESIKLEGVNASASQLAGTLGVLAPVLGGVAAVFAGPLLTSLPIVGTLFSGLTGPVGVLAGALIALFAIKPDTLLAGFEVVGNALPAMLNGIVGAIGNVIPTIGAQFAQNAPILINGFVGILDQLVGAVSTLVPMLLPVVVSSIATLADALLSAAPQLLDMGIVLMASLADGVVAALPELINAVPRIVSNFMASFTSVLPQLLQTGVSLIVNLVDGVLAAVPALIDAVPPIITSLVSGIVDALPMLITAGIDLVNGLIEGVVKAIPAIIDAVVSAIPMIITSLVDAVPALLQGGLKLIDGLVTGIVEGLPQIIDAVIEAIPLLIASLVDSLPALIKGGIDLVVGLATGIVKAIPQLIRAVVDAIPQLIKGLVSALPQLIQGGIQLVLGLIGGIIEAIPQLIVAVVAAIPQVIGGLLEALPQLIWGGIQLVFGLISGIVQAIPDIVMAVVNIIPQLITGLAAAFPKLTAFFTTAWSNITGTITAVWNGVVTFFSGIWTTITTNAQAAWAIFTSWISAMFNGIIATVTGIWNGLVSFFTGLWEGIKLATQMQWDAITSWLSSIFDGAVSSARSVWDTLSGFFRNLWNGVTSTFNTFLGFVKTKPREAFQAAVDAIGKVWEGIKTLAAKPVRFVIETVINGLIGTINKLPGVNIAKVPLPAGFARGGVLPGYQSAKRDDVLTPMRSGEGVLVPEVVRGLGASTIHALNAAGNTGGASAVRRQFGGMPLHPGRALGGLITPLPKDRWTVSQPYHGGHNGLDMAAAMGTPIQAAADGIVQLAQSVNMGGNEIYLQHKRLGTRYSHMSSFRVGAGQAVKQGQIIGTVGSTGMSTGPHLHYMVHNPNDGGNGFGYQNHVNPMPYIGTYGQAFDGFDLIAGLMDFATSKFKAAFPEGGMWVDAAGGIMRQGVEQLTAWGKGILGMDSQGSTGAAALGGAGAALYDRGGILPHGGIGVNLSGKPEAVLTSEEREAFKQLLSQGGGRDITFEAGAIVVQGALNPEDTSIAVMDRIVEELE